MNDRQTSATCVEQLDDTSSDFLSVPITTLKPKDKTLNGKNHALNHEVQKVKKKPTSREKDRITVQISKEIIERVKDCVYWNRLTVAKFVEDALEVALMESEKENGKPFQKRRSELKPGRPTK